MKKIVKLLTLTGAAAALVSCGNKASGEFKYLIDEFADLKVMRYDVPGWEELSLQQKEYVYHLAEAAKWGRDIYWDQNCKYNLELRKAVEKVLENYSGDRKGADFENFVIYAKRLFFSNGIHHHYAEDKFFPDCPKEYFASLLENAGVENRDFLLKLVYDPEFLPQRKASEGEDIVKASAVNFYEGVSRDEVEAYYASLGDPNDPCPPSYGLNSKVVKDAEGKVIEEVWNIEGAYGPAIAKIVEELEKAAKVTPEQLRQYPYAAFTQSDTNLNYAEEVVAGTAADFNQVVYVSDRATIYSVIAHTNCVSTGSGVLPDGFGDDRLVAVPLTGQHDMRLGYIKLRSVPLSDSGREFVEILQQILKELEE